MMEHMFNRGLYEGLSGGNWEGMPDYMKNMMQSYYGGLRPFVAVAGILDVVKEILVVVLLVAAIRWLWMKGGK